MHYLFSHLRGSGLCNQSNVIIQASCYTVFKKCRGFHCLKFISCLWSLQPEVVRRRIGTASFSLRRGLALRYRFLRRVLAHVLLLGHADDRLASGVAAFQLLESLRDLAECELGLHHWQDLSSQAWRRKHREWLSESERSLHSSYTDISKFLTLDKQCYGL